MGIVELDVVGKGIINIPEIVRDELGIELGDSVKIVGPSGSLIRTVSYGWRGDVNKYIGRLDEHDREQLGVEVGDKVKLFVSDDDSEDNSLLLFSYGSNHTQQLSDRIERDIRGEGISAYLIGWKLLFAGKSRNWGGKGVAIIKQTNDEDDEVCGYVVEVTPKELDKMDVHEAVKYDCYYRDSIMAQVAIEDGTFKERTVIAYLPGPKRLILNAPSKKYENAVKKTITEYWTGHECLTYLNNAVRESGE